MTIDHDCKACHFWDRNKHVAYTRHGTEILAACLNPEAPWVGMDCNGGCKFWTKRELPEPKLTLVQLCDACCQRIVSEQCKRDSTAFSEPRTID